MSLINCLSCKESVSPDCCRNKIEKRTFSITLVILLTTLIVNCKPSAPPPPPPPIEVGLFGQAFIVTQGGANIKLGLVEVKAIEESFMIDFMNQKRLNATAEAELYSEIRKRELFEELEVLVKTNKAAIASWEKDWKNVKLQAGMEIAERRLKSKKQEIADFDTELRKFMNIIRWFLDLPSPSQVAKTDADGNFALRLKPGRYALVADSKRKIADKTEEYYWLVWIDANEQTKDRVFLSNDNLIETYCPDCVVRASDVWHK